MITCREFIDFLMDYFTGTLPTHVCAKFAFHLTDCPDCFVYLQSYQATILLGKDAFTELNGPIPAEVPEGLVQAVLAAVIREP